MSYDNLAKAYWEAKAKKEVGGGASQCLGCGHIETLRPGPCAGCGGTRFTHYVPEPYAEPEVRVVVRGENECQRCGSKLDDPEESSFCESCEKYLGLN